MSAHMSTAHTANKRQRGQADDDRAKRWLQRQLEWEEILGALRDAGRPDRPRPSREQQEPAAA